MRSLLLIPVLAVAAQAQSIKGAVLAKKEPHHHVAYEDDGLRVLRVHVPAHDTTLLHEHDADYVWIALGPSTVVNAKLGVPDATISSNDLDVHYTPGKFAHVARNTTDKPFDNITIELLKPQTNPRNLCEKALADLPINCPPGDQVAGAIKRPELATDQLRVTLVTIAGGKSFGIPHLGTAWVIALDTLDTRRDLSIAGKWVGGTVRLDRRGTSVLSNHGPLPVSVLMITSGAR